MKFDRKTIRSEVSLEGRGLHSGEPVSVRLHPGAEGIWFRHGSDRVQALPESVRETNRATGLGPVGTVEHLMAALAGAEVTDIEVEVSYPEMPALDGSALPYLKALQDVGFETLGATELPTLFTRVFIHEGDLKLAISAGVGHWRYEFSSDVWPRFQGFECVNVLNSFESDVAPARTFGFERELPQIEAAGLARGLDRNSALLIGENGYANEARFDDEPARHKMLDAMGDLYLSGVPVRFLNVVAERTGHRINIQAAKKLRDAVFEG